MSNQAQKLQEIADAIRGVTNRNSKFKIVANNFANEISKLEPRIVNYNDKFENGYNGLKAVKCASSYLLARHLGTEKFAYRQTNILSPSLKVRDGEYARIDCSTFVSLCLRGIPYENSPYAKHKEADATWNPSTELESMYGTEGWEFTHLDKQDKYHRDGESIMFTDIGIEGHSSIRTAAHIAEYFYKNGYVVYDRFQHGQLTILEDLYKYELQPGDLVFFANPNNEKQAVLKRFRSITHCAIVSENTSFYYHVSGSESLFDQDVVLYQSFDEGILKGEPGDSSLDDDSHPIGQLLLVCRPDYRPKKKVETPIGVNLLGYPWTQSRYKKFTGAGLTCEVLDEHSLKLNGTGTGSTFSLKGYNSSNDHITLSPGTYQLSGIENRTSTAFALQVRDVNGVDFSNEATVVKDKLDKAIRYPDGNGLCYDTFTLTEETDVVVKLFCNSSVKLVDEIITPTLMRIA